MISSALQKALSGSGKATEEWLQLSGWERVVQADLEPLSDLPPNPGLIVGGWGGHHEEETGGSQGSPAQLKANLGTHGNKLGY